MRKWNYCSSLVLLLCLSFSIELEAADISDAKNLSVESVTQARDVVLKGKVTDKEGNELPGASILVDGTTVGTVTDINGEYSLRFVPKPNQKLIFSFVGLRTQAIPYTNQKVLNVVLEAGDVSLDDVVVIGYGNKNRKSLTSSIASMDKKEMERLSATTTTVDNLLAGTIKGVQTLQTSGEPGAPIKINVRGVTSPYPDLLTGSEANVPLFVIDGVPMFVNSGTNPLLNIAPSDIESIDVLKDAAATAIYGSRGANGVIIVKTKGGRKGEKMSVEATYTLSIGNTLKDYDPLSTAEFKDLQRKMLSRTVTSINEGWPHVFVDPYFLQKYGNIEINEETYQCIFNGLNDDYYGNANTNWVKEVQNKNATSHQYSVAVRGGSEKTNYSFSFNGLNQEGLQINDNFERYGARMSMDTEITKWLKFGAMMNYSYSSRKNGMSTMAIGNFGSFKIRPDITVFDEHGNYNKIDNSADGMGYQEYYYPNPVAEYTLSKLESVNNQVLGNAYLDIDIVKGLKFHTGFNYARYDYKSSSFTPKEIQILTNNVYEPEANVDPYSMLTTGRSTFTNVTTDFRLDYNLNIKNQAFSAMFGYSADRSWDESESFNYEDFPNDVALTNPSSANRMTERSDSYTRSGLNSVYGRLTYDYFSRYLVEASLRADASSKFGPGNQWGVFPAMSLGWRINNESFLKKVNQIDDLKIRFSWGKTGSTNIPDFAYKQFYVGGSNYESNVGVGLKNMLPNRDIRWEMTTEYNAGVDFAFFNSRITGNLDVYFRKTDGALAPSPHILESGFSLYYANIIDTSNKGVELYLSGDIIRNKDFTWNSAFNISANRSKLESLNSASISAYIQDFFVVGEPVGSSRGYVVEGIFQSQEEIDELNEIAISKDHDYYQDAVAEGDYKIKDINGDGTIDSNDKVVIANPEPKCFGGWSNTLTYKDWSLSFLFQFRCGGEALYDNLQMEAMSTNIAQNLMREYYENMWTPDNRDARYPQLVASSYYGAMNYNASNVDRYVFKTSYLRMKNITLSYTLPKKAMQKIGIQNASVFASATNLFTVSQWPGLDPEMVGTVTSTMSSSYDAYPMSRTFSLGLKVQF